MLEVNPQKRISAQDAAEATWAQLIHMGSGSRYLLGTDLGCHSQALALPRCDLRRLQQKLPNLEVDFHF